MSGRSSERAQHALNSELVLQGAQFEGAGFPSGEWQVAHTADGIKTKDIKIIWEVISSIVVELFGI
jgi:hypothetical protein